MEKLTRQEEDVMRRIWAIAPCFIKDVLAKYEEPKPPYTTVASVVKNLERKKYVKAKHYGNTYEYTPLISQDEYMKEFPKRNPNLRVFSAHLHMDEETPHLHIDFVPFVTGSKSRGAPAVILVGFMFEMPPRL